LEKRERGSERPFGCEGKWPLFSIFRGWGRKAVPLSGEAFRLLAQPLFSLAPSAAPLVGRCSRSSFTSQGNIEERRKCILDPPWKATDEKMHFTRKKCARAPSISLSLITRARISRRSYWAGLVMRLLPGRGRTWRTKKIKIYFSILEEGKRESGTFFARGLTLFSLSLLRE